jgi:uncharacterized membrane protein YhaH (DUF805 family)
VTADKLNNAFTSAWKRSFDYTGRSDRGDYWWFALANFIVLFLLNLIGAFVPFVGVLANLYLFAQSVPHLSLTVRRLKDCGREWAWILMSLIPLFGAGWLACLLTQPTV